MRFGTGKKSSSVHSLVSHHGHSSSECQSREEGNAVSVEVEDGERVERKGK